MEESFTLVATERFQGTYWEQIIRSSQVSQAKFGDQRPDDRRRVVTAARPAPVVSRGTTMRNWGACSEKTMRNALTRNLQSWGGGQHGLELIRTLRAIQVPRITRIVAFNCGSMAWAEEAQVPALIRHAIVLFFQREMAEQQQTPLHGIEVVVQDPLYTERDARVLRQAGCKIVHDPRGFLEIDEETLVISLASNIPVRQIVADLAKPAMMIWKKVADTPIPLASEHGLVGYENEFEIPYVQ